MYTIINNTNQETHVFTTVRKACQYLKDLKNDKSNVTNLDTADLCNIFAKYKNKIAINGIRNNR